MSSDMMDRPNDPRKPRRNVELSADCGDDEEKLPRTPEELTAEQIECERLGKIAFETFQEQKENYGKKYGIPYPTSPFPIRDPRRQFWFNGYYSAEVAHNVGHILYAHCETW